MGYILLSLYKRQHLSRQTQSEQRTYRSSVSRRWVYGLHDITSISILPASVSHLLYQDVTVPWAFSNTSSRKREKYPAIEFRSLTSCKRLPEFERSLGVDKHEFEPTHVGYPEKGRFSSDSCSAKATLYKMEKLSSRNNSVGRFLRPSSRKYCRFVKIPTSTMGLITAKDTHIGMFSVLSMQVKSGYLCVLYSHYPSLCLRLVKT